MEAPEQSGKAIGRTAAAPLSRRKFIALAGSSAVAVAFVAGCGSDGGTTSETSQFGDGDVGILNYALTLEHVEAAFYKDLVTSGLFSGNAKKDLGKFGEEEEDHISSLTKAVERLGGEPVAKPRTRFSLKNGNSALALGSKLENIAAAAYLGQLSNIESPPALATVLSIHSVEGRHAAAINSLLGKPPTPDGAFAKPARAKLVLNSVEPFIVD
jgi:rubrerythrin